MHYKLLHSLFILKTKLSQNLTRRILSSLLLCPFDMSIYPLDIPSLSGTSRHSRLILYLFCPSSGISHFLKKPVLFLLEEIPKYGHEVCPLLQLGVIAYSPSQWTELVCMYIFLNTHTHIIYHLSTMCLYLSIYEIPVSS